jgi:alpha-glucosidase
MDGPRSAALAEPSALGDQSGATRRSGLSSSAVSADWARAATPVGFSGDTISVWESLAYQPYFTATASNVLYGYWSHDIGGHMPGPIEPELYVRWIQFGVYSPVLRTHTTKTAESERRVWEYPSPYSGAMIDALRRRYELVPYIYGENRKCLDSAIALVRPMYYAWPPEAAYKAKNQYIFGDSIS